MNYNEVYYVMTPNYDEAYEILHITPSESTGIRRFHYREMSYGDPALNFISNGLDSVDEMPLMLFCKPSILVSEKLKNIFDDGVYGGKFFPAIVEDNKIKFDSYFLVNIFEELDCWSRKESVYKQRDPDYYPRVYEYRLDKSVLDKIEEKNRLIFRMGGADLSPVIVHERIKKIIERSVNSVNFHPINTYKFGDEF